LRVGFYGFGAISRYIARVVLERGWEITGAVDISPRLIGRDIGFLLGIEKYGVKVTSSPDTLRGSDVVFHATGSWLDRVFDQLVTLARLRVDVVSTCETLAYPYYRYPEIAEKLDREAKSNNVTIVGAGINPGFVLDVLPVVVSASLSSIERVYAVRSLDASKRRKPFQHKVGIGMNPSEYVERLKRRELTGHVGYAESIYLIGRALGVSFTKVEEGQEPLVAEEHIIIGDVEIEKGLVKGIRGYGYGYVDGERIVTLELYAYAGAEEYEEIVVEGSGYTIKWRSTGTPGDIGTASVVVNLAETVHEHEPGLVTVVDLLPFRPRFKKL